ncbi:hypothetical protein ES288_D01G252300v1 [Gossypium darwinii]|uniref:Uncharacterized protein n=1 Tax=Gossypium darwinii TaxID=34276 RepID=A0A5D2DTM1_GOSDA|nr:hypothetical protein ES288_D01G252300v1 [Gossypium darwinii]
MSYRFLFHKTFFGKHSFNLSFPLRPSTSASPPHRCPSSSWVINRFIESFIAKHVQGRGFVPAMPAPRPAGIGTSKPGFGTNVSSPPGSWRFPPIVLPTWRPLFIEWGCQCR